MEKTIYYNTTERRMIDTIREKIKQNTYTDQDFVLMLGLVKKNIERLDLFQTKMICELVQFLYSVKREERLTSELLELVDCILFSKE